MVDVVTNSDKIMTTTMQQSKAMINVTINLDINISLRIILV